MRIERLIISEYDYVSEIFGSYDENARVFHDELGVEVNADVDEIVLSGEEANVELALKVVTSIQELVKRGERIKPYNVRMIVDLVRDGQDVDIKEVSKAIAVTNDGKPIRCRTVGQSKYINAINRNGLTFCIGPAGTGKTYLAVARAVMAYKNKDIEKIILTRPAVEAGERLGFLPGDLQQKVDPYLRPLYDALQEMLGFDNYSKMIERGTIEVAPLAYMRGRTLSNAFIILDEAQNTTFEQMKMFLTRMGEGSKMVVTGDATQIDLPHGVKSGLLSAIDILKDIEGIAICRLSSKDVVRHDLVQRIVDAYDRHSKKNQ